MRDGGQCRFLPLLAEEGEDRGAGRRGSFCVTPLGSGREHKPKGKRGAVVPFRAIKSGADRLGRWSVIALGATIPISTALDNALLTVSLVCLLVGARLPEAVRIARGNPVVIAALLLFGMLALGTLYGDAAGRGALGYLSKYIDLLFVPVFAVFFRDADVRRKGLYALAAALALTALLSIGFAVGVLPKSPLFITDALYPVPFKHTLTQGILLSLGAFLFVQLAAAAASRRTRAMWLSLAALAALDVLGFLPGRTGFALIGLLALYCGYLRWSWTGVVRIVSVLAVLLIVAFTTSNLLHERVNRAIHEYASWTPGAAAGSGNSVGSRLEFYHNTLQIIRDHPWLGVGTGGFPQAYAAAIAGTAMQKTGNPHNEYLLLLAQTGPLGLLLLLFLFYRQWRLAPRLPTPLERNMARGVVITIAVGCFFNSLLLDHTEGLLFAWLTGLLFASLESPARQSAQRMTA